MTIHAFLLIALGFASAGAAWTWAHVFWQQLEPSARRVLGKHWDITIEWEETERRTAWEIRGPERGKRGRVALASVVVWMLGFFAPCLVVVACVRLQLLSPLLGCLLAFLSLLVSLYSWRLEAIRGP